MNIKANIKQRRQERIRQLLDIQEAQEDQRTVNLNLDRKIAKQSERQIEQPYPRLHSYDPSDESYEERDPELLWKKERNKRVKDDRYEDETSRPPRFLNGFLKRVVVSGILFGAIWGGFQWEAPFLQKAKFFIADSLHQEMNFSAASAWYTDHFGGAPSFLPIFQNDEDSSLKVTAARKLTPPILGTIAQPFAITMEGVEIVPDTDGGGVYQVESVDAGRVIQVINNPENGITVVIQHTGGLTGIYGRLAETKLETGSWVEEGGRIGQIPASTAEHDQTLYFALKEGDTYIDPAEVIAFD
ncbi:M23 family metallopeptidase [Neobacillus mesonae]|nr:M23 family metallopeptidase [Neobacillus mesonae]